MDLSGASEYEAPSHIDSFYLGLHKKSVIILIYSYIIEMMEACSYINVLWLDVLLIMRSYIYIYIERER